MAWTPDGLAAWITAIRETALLIVGVLGLTIMLIRYAQTGEISLPAVATFSGFIGFQALQSGKG
jgi:hypothetical protein